MFVYRTNPSGYKMMIVPASHSRASMDATTNRFANRCLPLKIAKPGRVVHPQRSYPEGDLGRRRQGRLEAEQRRGFWS